MIDTTRLDRLMAAMIDEGLHPGAQLTVIRGDETIYAWHGGRIDEGGQAVTADTLYQIRSVTKALTTVVMLHLYDRGMYQFEDRIADHWPEFAANGKERITIAHIMSHSAGIPDGPDLRARDMGSRGAIRTAVEAMTPIWEPGTRHGYHASSMGFVLDELIQRWTGQNTATLLEELVLAPLDIDDLTIGLAPTRFDRMAKMAVDPQERQKRPGRAAFSDFVNTKQGIALPLNWVMGVATANALARLFRLIATGGEVDGTRIFEPATLEHAMEPRSPPGAKDERLNHPIVWGLGFILGGSSDIYGSGAHPRAVGHAGGGASMAYADPDRKLSVAFLCNRMLGRGSWERYRRVADAIDELVA